MQTIKADPIIVEQLGKPIKLGWVPDGPIRNGQEACFDFVIEGSKSDARVSTVVEKSTDDQWHIRKLALNQAGDITPIIQADEDFRDFCS